jgi:hypothetical protein
MKPFEEHDGIGSACRTCGWRYDYTANGPELQPPPPRARRTSKQVYLDNFKGAAGKE